MLLEGRYKALKVFYFFIQLYSVVNESFRMWRNHVFIKCHGHDFHMILKHQN